MKKINLFRERLIRLSLITLLFFCAFTANALAQPPINVVFTHSEILCPGGLSDWSITITGGTAPYSVVNQNGGVLITGAQDGVTYSFAGASYAAHYDFTTTDANGATYLFSADIIDPHAVITYTPIVCPGGLSTIGLLINGGPGYYDVVDDAIPGNVLITGASPGVQYTFPNGTYAFTGAVRITNTTTGCVWTQAVSVLDPVANLTFSAIQCPGGLSDIGLMITGGSGHYDVVNQNGGVLISGALPNVQYNFPNGTYAATYVFTITNVETGCSWNTGTYTITEPSANFTFSPILCAGGMSDIGLYITGPAGLYDVVNQNGGVLISGASPGVQYNFPQGTIAGTYVFTITNTTTGCTWNTQSYKISQPAPVTHNYSFTSIQCYGGLSTQVMTINGGTAPYTVTNQGGGILISGALEGVTYTFPNSIGANNITYTITDANGCTSSFSVVISQPTQLSVNAGSDKSVIYPGTFPCTSLSGSAATGGTGPYTYVWSPGGSSSLTPTVCPTVNTTYTLTVTDANGCTGSDAATVNAFNLNNSNNGLPYVGNNRNKIYLCYNGITVAANMNGNCFASTSACWYLTRGATIGPCPQIQKMGIVEENLQADFDAYPNPFSDKLNIAFSFPDYSGQAEVQVFDLNGRLLTKPFEGMIQAGERYEVTFNGEGLANGMYYYRLIAGEHISQGKALYLKN